MRCELEELHTCLRLERGSVSCFRDCWQRAETHTHILIYTQWLRIWTVLPKRQNVWEHYCLYCPYLSRCLTVCIAYSIVYCLSPKCLPFCLQDLFIQLSVLLCVCLSTCLSLCRYACLHAYLSVCLSWSSCLNYLPTLSVCLPECLSVCQPIYISPLWWMGHSQLFLEPNSDSYYWRIQDVKQRLVFRCSGHVNSDCTEAQLGHFSSEPNLWFCALFFSCFQPSRSFL